MTQEKKKSQFTQLYTKDEQAVFAKALFEAKRNNPKWGWPQAMMEARKAMPPEKQFAASIQYPHSFVWLIKALKQLQNEAGIDLFLKSAGGQAKLTPEEQKAFAVACHKIRKTNLTLSWKHIFRQVNETLPEKQRIGSAYDNPSQMPWMLKLLAELAEQDNAGARSEERGLKTEEQKVQPDAVKPNPEPCVSSPIQETTLQITDLPVIQPEPAATNAAMLSLEAALINAIVGTVKPIVLNILQSPQFSAALIEAFKDAQQPKIGSITTHPVITQALQPPKERKKKIMIIGLETTESQEIQKEFAQLYDLRIYDNKVKADQIRVHLPTSDKIIAMAKHISHNTQDIIRGHKGFTFCNGSVTALKDLLKRLSVS